MAGQLRIRVDFERRGISRWLAQQQGVHWAYVDTPAEAGTWPGPEAARLWREHRGARAWAREFAHTEPADPE